MTRRCGGNTLRALRRCHRSYVGLWSMENRFPYWCIGVRGLLEIYAKQDDGSHRSARLLVLERNADTDSTDIREGFMQNKTPSLLEETSRLAQWGKLKIFETRRGFWLFMSDE